MKSKRKWFTCVLLLFLLVGLLGFLVFPETGDGAEKAEKQEKESTSFFKKVGKGFGVLFKPSNLRLELNGGWSAWGVGDFKRANEFIETTYQGSAAYTAETTGFSGSLLGGLKVFAEYRLSDSHKLGLGTGFKFLPGGSFEQVVNSPTESITRGYDMSAFAIPLEVSYKMPLKMKIFKKPLSLRFGAGLDFISSTIDYVFDRSVTAANGGLNNLSRTAANGSEHTVIKLRDTALGGHISVGLEYPFGKNFGLTLDAGYAFGKLDTFTGTYTDQQGERRDVVLGKDSEYGDYIAPYTYYDTVCPDSPTAGLTPGGPGISVGITYYPAKPQKPIYTRPEEVPPPPEVPDYPKIPDPGGEKRMMKDIEEADPTRDGHVGEEPPGIPWLEYSLLPEQDPKCLKLFYIWTDYEERTQFESDESREAWHGRAFAQINSDLAHVCRQYCDYVREESEFCNIVEYDLVYLEWWYIPNYGARMVGVASCRCSVEL